MTATIRVLDIETTGLKPPAGVVQVGFCDLRMQDGWSVVGGRACLCNPLHPIPPEMSAVHHIIDEDVAGKPGFTDLIRSIFDDGVEIDVVAAHNDRFDRQWITDDVIGPRRWIDTYRAALRLWPEAPSHSLHALRYWRNLKGIDRAIADNGHDAYADAYVTAHLLRDMLSVTTGKQLAGWSKGPALLPRLLFGKHALKPMAEVPTDYLKWIVDRGTEFDEDVLYTATYWLAKGEVPA